MKDENTPLSPTVILTDAQVDKIANLAAEKVIEEVYIQVGKNVIRKTLYFIGLVVFALLILFGKEITALW